MSDNSTLPASGDVYASDDIGGIKHSRIKLRHGDDGVNDGDVSRLNPLPTRPGWLTGKGRKTVTTAGTEVALVASSTPCAYVIVQALVGNTNPVTVGPTGVDGATATRDGIFLNAGESIPLPTNNVQNIFVDSITNGEGVSFLIFT